MDKGITEMGSLKDASGDPGSWKYQTADQSDQHTRRYLGVIER